MSSDSTTTPEKGPSKKHLRIVAERQAAGKASALAADTAAAGGDPDENRGAVRLAGAAIPPGAGGVPGRKRPHPAPADRPKRDRPSQPIRQVKRVDQKAGRVAKRKKLRTAGISLLVMVGIPALLASLYFGFLAADQYHAEARFAVRGTETAQTDIVGMLTGSPSGSASVGDSYILQQYIQSREMVEAVQRTVDVDAVYNRPEADYIAKLGHGRPIEAVVDYWAGMVGAEFDPYSGIISLEVKAFRPEDAQVVASAVVRESDALVNRLADKSRADAISFAQKELEFAEWRLQDARRALTTYQSSQRTFDPGANASANQALINELQGRLSDAESELTGLLALVDAESPSVRVLKTRIAALEAQIGAERQKIGVGMEGDAGSGVSGLSDQVAVFQELKTAEEFAQQVYVSALKGLESARANAKRNHSYLATFVSPMLPQDALYPKRLTDTLLIVLVAFGVWAIGGLLYAAVREHVA